LNAILGYADMIHQEMMGPLGHAKYKEYVGTILMAARILLGQVEETLDVASLEAGGTALSLRPVAIGPVVAQTVDLLRLQAESGGVRLVLDLPPSDIVIHTDENRLRQILTNLAGNAIKYTPRGGQVRIEVAVAPEGDALIMVVRDTGVGIRPEDMQTVMKPFGRVHSPLTEHAKGTGLGMPLTRRFVELLGGTLDLASTPGHGTVVTIRLPGIK
jgi:signal transduction histidine kinase